MNTYKTILNTIVEPILEHDEQRLHEVVTRLKQADGESWAVGEMLERALRYVPLAVALAEERGEGGG
jgi:hypothetical protein